MLLAIERSEAIQKSLSVLNINHHLNPTSQQPDVALVSWNHSLIHQKSAEIRELDASSNVRTPLSSGEKPRSSKTFPVANFRWRLPLQHPEGFVPQPLRGLTFD